MEEGGGGERGGGGLQEEVQVSTGKVGFHKQLSGMKYFYILDIQLEFYLMSNSSLPDYCCRFVKICVALL